MEAARRMCSPISKYCSSSAHSRHSPVSGVGFLYKYDIVTSWIWPYIESVLELDSFACDIFNKLGPKYQILTRAWQSWSTSRPSSDSSADHQSCSAWEGGRAGQARRRGRHLVDKTGQSDWNSRSLSSTPIICVSIWKKWVFKEAQGRMQPYKASIEWKGMLP